MATSTFDKRIVIDDDVANRLISILDKPAPPRPDVSGLYRMMTGEDWECFMQRRSAKLLEQAEKKQ